MQRENDVFQSYNDRVFAAWNICSRVPVLPRKHNVVWSRLWFCCILPGSNYLLFPLGLFLSALFVSSQLAQERMWVINKRCGGFNLASQKILFSNVKTGAERGLWAAGLKREEFFLSAVQPSPAPAVMGETQVLSWWICPMLPSDTAPLLYLAC